MALIVKLSQGKIKNFIHSWEESLDPSTFLCLNIQIQSSSWWKYSISSMNFGLLWMAFAVFCSAGSQSTHLPAHPRTQMLTFLSGVKQPCLFYGVVILRLEDCWAWKRSLTPACYLAINKFGLLWTSKYSRFLCEVIHSYLGLPANWVFWSL